MFRKVGVTVAVASATLASSLLTVAVATAVPAGAADGAVAPAPGPDVDGDGVETTHVQVTIDTDGVVVAFAGAPDAVYLDGAPAGSHLRSRIRAEDGWSSWEALTASADEAPDTADPVVAVGPLWVRGADAIELAIDAGDPAITADLGVMHLTPVPASHAASTEPTTTTTTSSTTTTTTTPGDGTTPAAEAADADTADLVADGDFIHPRNDWATEDMGWACAADDLVDVGSLDAAVVHHTAGRNDYTPEDVPDIIRAIWRYHVGTRGWCDIAYNFVIDRFGQVWEARQGGIGRVIRGGHTRGFNTGTVGIAQLGDFSAGDTPQALTAATRRLLGYKLGIHHVDPGATVTVVNRSGGDVHGVANGDEMEIPTIVGHRDLGSTACPGDNTYVTLAGLRHQAELGVDLVALQRAFLGWAEPGEYGRLWAIAESDGLGAAATDLAFSESYAGVIIDDMYENVLGRPAEPAGRAYWLDQMAAGMRVEKVGAIFYGSDEYLDAAGSTEAWVTALYDHLLHRAPEADGLAFWAATLDGGFLGPPEIATGFYESIESRLDRVSRLYDRFLGRQPDPEGHAYWAEQLLETDDVLLAVHLSLSDEFLERATS